MPRSDIEECREPIDQKNIEIDMLKVALNGVERSNLPLEESILVELQLPESINVLSPPWNVETDVMGIWWRICRFVWYSAVCPLNTADDFKVAFLMLETAQQMLEEYTLADEILTRVIACKTVLTSLYQNLFADAAQEKLDLKHVTAKVCEMQKKSLQLEKNILQNKSATMKFSELACLYYSRGELQRALAEAEKFKSSIELHEESKSRAQNHLLMAQLLAMQGDFDSLFKHTEKNIKDCNVNSFIDPLLFFACMQTDRSVDTLQKLAYMLSATGGRLTDLNFTRIELYQLFLLTSLAWGNRKFIMALVDQYIDNENFQTSPELCQCLRLVARCKYSECLKILLKFKQQLKYNIGLYRNLDDILQSIETNIVHFYLCSFSRIKLNNVVSALQLDCDKVKENIYQLEKQDTGKIFTLQDNIIIIETDPYSIIGMTLDLINKADQVEEYLSLQLFN